MSARIAFPFLTLSERAVRAEPWMVGLDDKERVPAGDYLPDWDYASRISLRRTILVDLNAAATDLDIAPEYLNLTISVRVGTGTGRLPRALILQQKYRCGQSDPTLIELEIPGHGLSAVLDLMTEIVISEIPDAFGELSPSKRSDRVWHDSSRIRLEGEEPRFPIEVADFGALLGEGIARSAPWYVHWSPGDWSREFHGSMRLYLNRDHQEFVDRVQKGDPEILRAIMADVMGQVCERFVSLEDNQALVSAFEPGSLGSQAAAWIKTAWPDRDLSFVQAQLNSRPGSFRAAMHALAEQRGIDQ